MTTTVADPSKQPAPNVLSREFMADGPNRKWVSDITPTPIDGGDLYLAATMDLCSKMIIGWSIRETMKEELVQQAFDMAVQQRWPDPSLLHHSDQGSQYTANGFRGHLRTRKMVLSNSRRGNVWDNAPMEFFFSTVEMELLRKKRIKTKAEAIQEMFTYIEIFYNRKRIHSALSSRSSVESIAAGRNQATCPRFRHHPRTVLPALSSTRD